jgi:hypothetical protein
MYIPSIGMVEKDLARLGNVRRGNPVDLRTFVKVPIHYAPK